MYYPARQTSATSEAVLIMMLTYESVLCFFCASFSWTVDISFSYFPMHNLYNNNWILTHGASKTDFYKSTSDFSK